ncbi:MAG: hypothetical protein ACHQVS_00815 [Candidatus Babeliales bacterium]
MNQPSRNVTLLTLLAIALATCAPTIYAANESAQVQSQEAPVTMTKLTGDQKNMVAQVVGGTLIALAIIVAAIVIKKQLK